MIVINTHPNLAAKRGGPPSLLWLGVLREQIPDERPSQGIKEEGTKLFSTAE